MYIYYILSIFSSDIIMRKFCIDSTPYLSKEVSAYIFLPHQFRKRECSSDLPCMKVCFPINKQFTPQNILFMYKMECSVDTIFYIVIEHTIPIFYTYCSKFQLLFDAFNNNFPFLCCILISYFTSIPLLSFICLRHFNCN